MVTMTSNGITLTVPENEVALYQRAGYVKVEPEKIAEPLPEEKQAKSKK